MLRLMFCIRFVEILTLLEEWPDLSISRVKNTLQEPHNCDEGE